MKVLVTGATGFIGRGVCLALRGRGHEVVAWVRSPERALPVLGAEVDRVPVSDGPARALEGVDAVVNLAGAPIVGRWTPQRRARLRHSRVDLTRSLVQAMADRSPRPRALVSASAVGYYGDGGHDALSEDHPAGSDFLAELCREWESAAFAARDLGIRVAVPRIGVVLGLEGGALPGIEASFDAGFGTVVGSGHQYVPWIHREDLVQMLVTALEDDRWSGPFNATAPHPVTMGDLVRALGTVRHRPVLARVPPVALRLALGDAAAIFTASLRAVPARARSYDFAFRWPHIADALHDLRVDPRGVQTGPAHHQPDHPYLRNRPPRHLLQQTTRIPAPLESVFPFFSQAANLGALTPPTLSFAIRTPEPIAMDEGTTIDYRIRLRGLPLSWRTVIEAWDPPHRFVDAQHAGPYASWFHEHRFVAEGNHTRMEDRVWYSPPLGPVGLAAHTVSIRPQLRAIFRYRAGAVRLRFPS